mgnify:CR=1 FL=1
MKLTDYDFHLPTELIAQRPIADRSQSKLLVLNRETGEQTHTQFSQLSSYLRPNDLLVLNDSRVRPARCHRPEACGRIRLENIAVEILNNKGYSYILRGDYARARRTLLAAQAKDPANPFIKNNLELLNKSAARGKAVR